MRVPRRLSPPFCVLPHPRLRAFEALAAQLGLASPMDLFNATYNATAANITALHVIPGRHNTEHWGTAQQEVRRPSSYRPDNPFLSCGHVCNQAVSSCIYEARSPLATAPCRSL